MTESILTELTTRPLLYWLLAWDLLGLLIGAGVLAGAMGAVVWDWVKQTAERPAITGPHRRRNK